ncbi:hypothetical protein BC567DRAFT_235395 [Phyllosticta citribraziliensis]
MPSYAPLLFRLTTWIFSPLSFPIVWNPPRDEKRKYTERKPKPCATPAAETRGPRCGSFYWNRLAADRVALRHPLIVPAIVTTCELATVIEGTAAEPNWNPDVYGCLQPVSRTRSRRRPCIQLLQPSRLLVYRTIL